MHSTDMCVVATTSTLQATGVCPGPGRAHPVTQHTCTPTRKTNNKLLQLTKQCGHVDACRRLETGIHADNNTSATNRPCQRLTRTAGHTNMR